MWARERERERGGGGGGEGRGENKGWGGREDGEGGGGRSERERERGSETGAASISINRHSGGQPLTPDFDLNSTFNPNLKTKALPWWNIPWVRWNRTQSGPPRSDKRSFKGWA